VFRSFPLFPSNFWPSWTKLSWDETGARPPPSLLQSSQSSCLLQTRILAGFFLNSYSLLFFLTVLFQSQDPFLDPPPFLEGAVISPSSSAPSLASRLSPALKRSKDSVPSSSKTSYGTSLFLLFSRRDPAQAGPICPCVFSFAPLSFSRKRYLDSFFIADGVLSLGLPLQPSGRNTSPSPPPAPIAPPPFPFLCQETSAYSPS